MAQKRAADEESPSVNGADGDQSLNDDTRKRQRTDSTQPWQNSFMRAQPSLTQDEKLKLKKWLDKKAAANEFPFPVIYPNAANKGAKAKKGQVKRKSDSGHHEKRHVESLTLDGHEYGEVAFAIGNKGKWDQLTKYRRCTVSEQTFVVGACVLVRSDEEVGDGASAREEDVSLAQWKAQIHEVRALDENHVYLRVSWLFRPSRDLPGGAKPYHGLYELIPTTEMEIIDAKTINAPLNVKYWDEYKEDEAYDATEYFWRQSYDHLTQALTACRSMCHCLQPQNPDRRIVQCSNCHEWLHAKCIEQDVLDKYLASHPASETIAVNGGTEDDKSQAHPKLKSKPKKQRASKAQELSGETEADGVTAVLNAPHDDSAVTVTLTDKRADSVVTDEAKVQCLCCEQAIEA
ncbi:hypothetical protein K461DRAFT_275796 [Myriangium duriaei CBS 260.36]|uniref:BAH domain-containing protein n=1 Tax=Myriangium duriaei CBS 260.36 TaxID=1168546 RepID=A0A9P4J399_9PEZI|nr:hypothetical protein K461DRAFT_275796 [Myriangium duriaei CBS 260.36]